MRNHYSTERDVRADMKTMMPGKILWVEQAAGGTVGVFDALVFVGDRLVPVELKIGIIVDGGWKVNLRPSQMAVARQLVENGVPAFVVVGAMISISPKKNADGGLCAGIGEKGLWYCSVEEAVSSVEKMREVRMKPFSGKFRF